jgi:hypothetical protein
MEKPGAIAKSLISVCTWNKVRYILLLVNSDKFQQSAPALTVVNIKSRRITTMYGFKKKVVD